MSGSTARHSRGGEPCAEPEGEEGFFDDAAPPPVPSSASSSTSANPRHPPTPEKPMLTLGAVSEDDSDEDDDASFSETPSDGESDRSSTRPGDHAGRRSDRTTARDSNEHVGDAGRSSFGRPRANTNASRDENGQRQRGSRRRGRTHATSGNAANPNTMKGSTPGGPCIIMQVAILIACCGMMAFVAHQMYKANEEHQEIIRASLREAGRGSRTGTLSPPPAGGPFFPPLLPSDGAMLEEGDGGGAGLFAPHHMTSRSVDIVGSFLAPTQNSLARQASSSSIGSTRNSRKSNYSNQNFAGPRMTRHSSASTPGRRASSGSNGKSRQRDSRPTSTPARNTKKSRESRTRNSSRRNTGSKQVALLSRNGTSALLPAETNDASEQSFSDEEGSGSDSSSSDGTYSSADEEGLDEDDYGARTRFSSRTSRGSGSTYNYRRRASGSSSIGKKRLSRAHKNKFNVNRSKNKVVNNYYTIQHMGDEAGLHFFGAGFASRPPQQGAAGSAATPGPTVEEEVEEEHGNSESGAGGAGKTKSGGVPNAAGEGPAERSAAGGEQPWVLSDIPISGSEAVTETTASSGEQGRRAVAVASGAQATTSVSGKLAIQDGSAQADEGQLPAELLAPSDHDQAGGRGGLPLLGRGDASAAAMSAVRPATTASGTIVIPDISTGTVMAEQASSSSGSSPAVVAEKQQELPDLPIGKRREGPLALMDEQGGAIDAAALVTETQPAFATAAASAPLTSPAAQPAPAADMLPAGDPEGTGSDLPGVPPPLPPPPHSPPATPRAPYEAPNDGTSNPVSPPWPPSPMSSPLTQQPAAADQLQLRFPADRNSTALILPASPALEPGIPPEAPTLMETLPVAPPAVCAESLVAAQPPSNASAPASAPPASASEGTKPDHAPATPEQASEIEHLRKEIPVMLASLKTYARLVVRLQNSANKKRKKHSGYPARLARKALAAFERRRNGELPTPERVLGMLQAAFGVSDSAHMLEGSGGQVASIRRKSSGGRPREEDRDVEHADKNEGPGTTAATAAADHPVGGKRSAENDEDHDEHVNYVVDGEREEEPRDTENTNPDQKRRQHESALADEIKREVSTGHVAGPFQLQEPRPTEYAADNGAAFTEEIESRSPADLLNYLRSSKTAVQFAMQKLWLFVSARIGHFKIDLRADYELQKVQPGAPQPASGAASGSSRGGARGVITRSTSGGANNPLSPLANFFQNSFAPTSGASASGAAPDRFSVMGGDAAGSEVNAGPSTIYQHAVKYECDFLGVKPHVIGTREEVPLIDVHAMDALDSSSEMAGPNGRVGGTKAPGLADDLVAQWRPMLDEFSSMSTRNGGRSTGSVMPAFASSSGASHNDETSIFGSMGGMLGDDADSPENSMQTLEEFLSTGASTSSAAPGANRKLLSPTSGSLGPRGGAAGAQPLVGGGADVGDANILVDLDSINSSRSSAATNTTLATTAAARRFGNFATILERSHESQDQSGDTLPGAAGARGKAAAGGGDPLEDSLDISGTLRKIMEEHEQELQQRERQGQAAGPAEEKSKAEKRERQENGTERLRRLTPASDEERDLPPCPPGARGLHRELSEGSEIYIPCSGEQYMPSLPGTPRGTARERDDTTSDTAVVSPAFRAGGGHPPRESYGALRRRRSGTPQSGTPEAASGRFAERAFQMPMVGTTGQELVLNSSTGSAVAGPQHDDNASAAAGASRSNSQVGGSSRGGFVFDNDDYSLLPNDSLDSQHAPRPSYAGDEESTGVPFPEGDGGSFSARSVMPTTSPFFDGSEEDELALDVGDEMRLPNGVLVPINREDGVVEEVDRSGDAAGDRGNILDGVDVPVPTDDDEEIEARAGLLGGNAEEDTAAETQTHFSDARSGDDISAVGDAESSSQNDEDILPIGLVQPSSVATPSLSRPTEPFSRADLAAFLPAVNEDELKSRSSQGIAFRRRFYGGATATPPGQVVMSQGQDEPAKSAGEETEEQQPDTSSRPLAVLSRMSTSTSPAGPPEQHQMVDTSSASPSGAIPLLGPQDVRRLRPRQPPAGDEDVSYLTEKYNSQVLGKSSEQLTFWKTLLTENADEWDALPAASKPGIPGYADLAPTSMSATWSHASTKNSMYYDRIVYQCHQRESEKFFKMEPKTSSLSENGGAASTATSILQSLFALGGVNTPRKPPARNSGTDRTFTMVDARGLPKPLRSWVPLHDAHDASLTVPIGFDKAVLEPAGTDTRFGFKIGGEGNAGVRVVAKRETKVGLSEVKEKIYALPVPQEAARLAQKLSVLLAAS